jgi:hypothetical protein
MPLTTSHPAAAIPLARLNLDLSALVIGSMTPDLVYFIPGCLPLSDFSHTIIGIIVLGIPMGLAALAIFEYLIKFPALTLMPAAHQRRLYSVTGAYSFFPAARFLRIAASVLAGAVTHIAWDSFTHLDGWVVRRIPALQSTAFVLFGSNVQVYKILQHGSTLLGIFVLLYWYIGWYRKATPVSVPERYVLSNRGKLSVFSVILLTSGAIAAAAAFARGDFWRTSPDQLNFFRIGYIVLVSAITMELVAFGLYRRWKKRV